MPTGALVDLGGASNLNVLVLDGARRLVARVYRPSVSAPRLGDLQHVRRRLAARGFPCLVPIAASDGSAWTTVGGRLVEVEEYVDHDAHMKTWQRVETGLRVLGGMHEVLSSIAGSPDGRAPRFVNHIAPEDVEEATARGAARIRSWSPTAEEARLADAAEELAQTISDQQKSGYAELPRQLVHGDFWDDNVLYRGGDIVLVHDFDHMSERARIDDLALTLYYLSSEPSADLERDGLRLLLRRLVDAYDSGLESGLSRRGEDRAAGGAGPTAIVVGRRLDRTRRRRCRPRPRRRHERCRRIRARDHARATRVAGSNVVNGSW